MAEIENKYGSIVTDVGVQLITEAVMEGQKVNITTLAVGDGGGSYYKPNSTMTALKGEKWRGKVNRVPNHQILLQNGKTRGSAV